MFSLVQCWTLSIIYSCLDVNGKLTSTTKNQFLKPQVNYIFVTDVQRVLTFISNSDLIQITQVAQKGTQSSIHQGSSGSSASVKL
jgi:hypothetical protein